MFTRMLTARARARCRLKLCLFPRSRFTSAPHSLLSYAQFVSQAWDIRTIWRLKSKTSFCVTNLVRRCREDPNETLRNFVEVLFRRSCKDLAEIHWEDQVDILVKCCVAWSCTSPCDKILWSSSWNPVLEAFAWPCGSPGLKVLWRSWWSPLLRRSL